MAFSSNATSLKKLVNDAQKTQQQPVGSTPSVYNPGASAPTGPQKIVDAYNPATGGTYTSSTDTSRAAATVPTAFAAPPGTVSAASVQNPGSSASRVPGTSPLTGAAAQYTPESLQSGMLYSNPQVLVQNALAALGIPANPGLVNQIASDANAMMAMQFILNGGGNLGSSNIDSATVNWLNNYIQNMATPGGNVASMTGLANRVLNANPTSPLGQYLGMGATGALTPDQQISNVNNMMMASAMSGNPYFQTALKNALQGAGTGFINASATNPSSVSDYVNYLRGTPLAGWFG